MVAATLTPREVSELSDTPKHVVEKAIEEGVLRVRNPARAKGRRMLPPHAVVYASLVCKIDLKLTPAHKKRLYERLTRLSPHDMRKARVELAPAIEIDVGRLVGNVLERAERYREVRDASIRIDESIMGGTPVILGTRMTVYSVLGRIEHGETVDDILADNPDLKRETIEAAITYARSHPPMGRPSGRPWVDVA
ncbi:MAG TPA: DUF433 domain-containing protein [Rhizomicrobium sp.]|nr:DUF433 domain-containing protein [Rhizomicrobium sp.]